MCTGSEAGSYLRRVDFAYYSTLGLREMQKKTLHSSAALQGKTSVCSGKEGQKGAERKRGMRTVKQLLNRIDKQLLRIVRQHAAP